MLVKAIFYIYCWEKVILKTCAIWKQSYFFCQWNAIFYYSIMRNNTDSVISFLMKGQTEI